MQSKIENAVWNDDELSRIRNVDRILPSQSYFSKMYNGGDFYSDLQRVIFSVIPSEPEWDIETKPGMTYSVMGSDINTLRFYQFIIRSHGYKKVLELGTYIGVSAMYMADAVGESGFVTTVEKGKEFYDIACRNFNKNNAINIRIANEGALEFVKENKGLYDLILIDAAKEIYLELLECSLDILAPNGLILVDDVFFQGDTLNNTATSEKGTGVRKMLDYVATLEGYEKVILPIGNGLLMVRKISS